jgi:hypothetical protein
MARGHGLAHRELPGSLDLLFDTAGETLARIQDAMPSAEDPEDLQKRIVRHRKTTDSTLEHGLSNGPDRIDEYQDPGPDPNGG